MFAGLERLEKAMGDGRLIAVHSYILCKEGRWYATDGKLCASVPVESLTPPPVPFCVRGDLLLRVAKRPEASISAIDSTGITVRYRPRGRVTFRTYDAAEFPLFENSDDASFFEVIDELKDAVEALAPFRGDGAVSPWNSSLHFNGAFAFAADSAAIARYEIDTAQGFALAPWLVTFMQGQPLAPRRIGVSERVTTVEWPGGLIVHARNVEDDAPEGVWTIATNMEYASQPLDLLDGFVDSVKRVEEYGASSFRITPDGLVASVGANAAAHGDIAEEWGDVRPAWAEGNWNIERVLKALRYATHLDLDGTTKRAAWHSPKMRGMLMGMTG